MAILSYQLKLIKMRADLAVLNNCAVPFLSRAAVNMCCYYILMKQKRSFIYLQNYIVIHLDVLRVI